MKSRYIDSRPENRRLVLLYAGWGMDWRPFRNVHAPEGYDLMVVWDYRDLTFSWRALIRYDEICLVAWSMGVFAASLTIHEIDPRITKRIAVCGTLSPVSDHFGIPEAIYHGTINALTPRGLQKFYRRMCTSAEEFAAFRENMPRRPVDELIDELQAIETHCLFHTTQVDTWDVAIVGRHDAIFPYQNQMSAWNGKAPVYVFDMGHLPDFDYIISRFIIDKQRVERRFNDSADTYESTSEAQQKIARTLYNLFNVACGGDMEHPVPIYGNVLEIGPGHGALTRCYLPALSRDSSLTLWDIADVDTALYAPDACFVKCDAEVAIRRKASRSVAMILSASAVQWFNSPALFLRECARVLIPGGYLVMSAFVSGNLPEVMTATGVGLNLPSESQWQAMMPSDMILFVCQASSMRLWFDSPRQVMEHLRQTGVNALGHNISPVRMARLMLENYPSEVAVSDGDGTSRCPLTYKPVFIIARKISDV